ncbi:MAG: zinc ABC transporter substrate-binding protein [Rickettsiales bacterium]|nr:zinc ABC transporter substrate-binding protein [Rickettsiales bacterium]
MKFLKFFILFVLSAKAALAQDNPIIVASINPIYQIVLAITGDKNNTILIINPSASDHDYQLKKSDAEKINKADLVFFVDENLEQNFAKIAKTKNSYQLSQVPQIKLLQSRSENKKTDLHLWMNPQNGVKIAEFVTQKICEIDVAGCKKYQKNLEIFRSKIAKTEKKIRAEFSKIKNQNYVFYHDAYQYFEEYFALKPLQIISKNHESYLTVKNLRDFDSLVSSQKIKCLFGDVVDEKNSAQKLAQNYKIKFAKLDPIGGEGGYEKLLTNVSDVMIGCLTAL